MHDLLTGYMVPGVLYLNNVRFSSRRSREHSVMQSWSNTKGFTHKQYTLLLFNIRAEDWIPL